MASVAVWPMGTLRQWGQGQVTWEYSDHNLDSGAPLTSKLENTEAQNNPDDSSHRSMTVVAGMEQYGSRTTINKFK